MKDENAISTVSVKGTGFKNKLSHGLESTDIATVKEDGEHISASIPKSGDTWVHHLIYRLGDKCRKKQTEKNGMDALMEYAYFQFYFMEQQIALRKTKLMELSGVK